MSKTILILFCVLLTGCSSSSTQWSGMIIEKQIYKTALGYAFKIKKNDGGYYYMITDSATFFRYPVYSRFSYRDNKAYIYEIESNYDIYYNENEIAIITFKKMPQYDIRTMIIPDYRTKEEQCDTIAHINYNDIFKNRK